MTPRTLQDLESARARLERALEQFELSLLENPNANRTKIDEAHDEYRAIERELKEAGILMKTAQELLGAELDSAFPDAAGTDVVSHKGHQYKRTFFAVRKTRRGKVQQWG